MQSEVGIFQRWLDLDYVILGLIHGIMLGRKILGLRVWVLFGRGSLGNILGIENAMVVPLLFCYLLPSTNCFFSVRSASHPAIIQSIMD